MMRKLACVFLLILVAACSERSTLPPPGVDSVVKTYPAHERKVRLVKGDLPSGTRYEVLGKIKAIEDFYGPQSKAETSLAGIARTMGADAVINERAWHSPRLFAWAVPHAEGTAVKILSTASVDLDAVPGEWY
jgi:uncharacterized protein YbjQ (UPF0145 family)